MDSDVSLKEHIESRLKGMEIALSLAKDQVDKTLSGFPLEYMRKAEYEKAHDQICNQVNDVKKMMDALALDIKNNVYPKLENKATQMVATIILSGLVSGLFVALASGLIRHLWP